MPRIERSTDIPKPEITLKKRISIGLAGLSGIGLLGFAIFANRFGFDKENDWESGRVSVLVAGGLLLLLAFLLSGPGQTVLSRTKKWGLRSFQSLLQWPPLHKSIETIRHRLSSWITAWSRTPLVRGYAARVKQPLQALGERIRVSQPVRYVSGSQERKATPLAIFLSIGVIVFYIWSISAGSWTEWHTLSTYYSKLADAFWHKQVSLLEEPPPALSTLANPYEKENREGIPYLWDAIFYNDKYYLYWGPAPALLLSAVRVVYSGAIGDQYLVFAFLCGEFLVSVLFLLKLRNVFFPNMDGGWVIPGILMAGLSNPLPLLVNSPAVYEAAVAGGQFFLILAMYLGFTYAIEKEQKKYGKLAALGFCLAFSAASRVSLIPALIFLFCMIAWTILRRSTLSTGKKTISLGILGLPFAIGIASLGWYNLVRFGSLFEFGLRYQLTSADLNAIYDYAFSWANIPANLYIYLLNPFHISTTFPYIQAHWSIQYILYPIKSPAHCYFAGPVSGLLLDVPYVLFALIAIFFMLKEGGKRLRMLLTKQSIKSKNTEGNLLQWTLLTFGGVTALAFGPILLFFAVTMRYLADLVPVLVLLSSLGSWIGIEYLIKKTTSKKWFTLLIILLTISSIIISVLLPRSFV